MSAAADEQRRILRELGPERVRLALHAGHLDPVLAVHAVEWLAGLDEEAAKRQARSDRRSMLMQAISAVTATIAAVIAIADSATRHKKGPESGR